MKYMIASDIHGSACYCRAMLEAFEREQADRLLLLGDILYHGPRNDLPEEYDPKQVIGLLNAYRDRIFCVCGNCDSAVDQMVLEFPIMAEYAVIDAGECLVYATHGHVFNEKHLPPLQKGDVLLYGHTHVPKCDAKGDITFMNPGSVSIPKEDSWHGYMTLENGLFIWKDLGGTERLRFDLKSK